MVLNNWFENAAQQCTLALSGIRPSLIESWATPSVSFFSAKSFKLTSVNRKIFVSPVGHDTKWIFNSEPAYYD